MQIGYTVGSLLINTVAGWRYMFGFSVPLAVIMGIGMWWLPCSPRWILLCALQGKGDMRELKETAICCLCQLRGEAVTESAAEEVNEILAELSDISKENDVKLGDMFRSKCLKALTIGAGLVLFQQVFLLRNCPGLHETRIPNLFFMCHCLASQITGQPSVLYYAGSIFQVIMYDLSINLRTNQPSMKLTNFSVKLQFVSFFPFPLFFIYIYVLVV